ncbi:MAG: DUF1569 domain-containing protein [Polyangiaceae bacterium]
MTSTRRRAARRIPWIHGRFRGQWPGPVRILEDAAGWLASRDASAFPKRSDAGAFSAGAALAHCAQSITFSLTGFPSLRSGLFRATIGRVALAKFLKQGFLRHDLRAPIPGAPDLPELTWTEGKELLLDAIRRYRMHEGPFAPHFAYGVVTKSEGDRVHAMHVADHLTPRPPRNG